MSLILLKRSVVTTLGYAFVVSLALGQPSSGESRWYIAAQGGYSSGWDADEHFVFSNVPTAPVSTNPVPLVQWVTSSSMPIASLVVGYTAPLVGAFGFHAEIEGIYQPQKFKIETTSAPFYVTPLSGLTHTAREVDVGYLANIGATFSKSKLQPMLMLGFGRNTSSAARTSSVWQLRSGVSWAIMDSVSLTADVRYLRVSRYSVDGDSFGPYSVGRKYHFGARQSISGALGVRVRF